MSNDSRGRFVWYDLMTTDREGAQSFYTQLIGWEIEVWGDMDPPYPMWKNGDTSIGGCDQLPEEAQKAGAPPHWLAYIATPDVDATAKRAGELGATIMVPPTDIPQVGRFSVIADPQGATFAAFTSANETPAPDGPPGIGQMSWHELMTTDYAAAFGFYEELFGWQRGEAMDMGPAGIYQLYGLSPEVPLGGMFNKPEELPCAWLYYISVPDVHAAAERAKELGATVVNGPMEVPGGDHVVQCLDPQGAMFAMHSTAAKG